MKKLSRQECINLQLQIMDKIHDYCMANNLRYSLGGGTMLGAVRHKGFIPWDDDVDIMMPRPDYEKFIKGFHNKFPHLEIDDVSTNPDYVSAFAKVVDNRTFAVGPNIIDDRGIFVDIFPIDGMPEDNDAKLKDSILYLLDDIRRAGKYYKYAKTAKQKSVLFFKYCLKRLKTPSCETSFSKLQKIIDSYPFDKCKESGCLISQYGFFRERQPHEVFLNYSDIQFENRKYRCVSNYHSYLSTLYGDYMQLPPVEQRVGTHFEEVFLK